MTAQPASTCSAITQPHNSYSSATRTHMKVDTSHGNWDFGAAIDLLRSSQITLPKPAKEGTAPRELRLCPELYEHRKDVSDTAISLGNFDSIFSALGLPFQSPLAPSSDVIVSAEKHKNTYPKVDVVTRPKKLKKEGIHLIQETSCEKLEKRSSLDPQDDIDLGRNDHKVLEIEQRAVERLVHSDSESRKPDTESQVRRDVINSLLGTPPRPIFKSRRTELTPASIRPHKTVEIQSHEPSFSPSSLSTHKVIKLMNMLYERFPKDTPYLSTLYSTPSKKVPPKAHDQIHVFVDISNILIGFHDTLKTRRGLSKEFRLPRQRLSFQKLSLILERSRPTAKRELVGSDRLESIVEAEVIGYKTNILERVNKIKELTERQKFFKKIDRRSGASSGSDLENGRSTQVRRVEQGVDEILHLKMSHSLLDSEVPSTIVLATGDAAEAEYSDGFLAMVERALERNWNVELVAFKGNTSKAYSHQDWTSRWGDRFRIIELDDFTDLLHLE